MRDAIVVDRLSKKYRLGPKKRSYRTLRETIVGKLSNPFRQTNRVLEGWMWALKDVSFTIHRGEVVGIIGRNGAGKTTVLKILSQITEPTEGDAYIHGRVGSLLEVGTGFHPELTGRENIYLNGAILGMKRTEIERKFDEIVAFAEVERFIDTPVKHYSTGMYTRLAFAVAAHLEPDILIVDEVLAVGDASFQKKCLGKMKDVAKGGRTVLFVSHNMAAITQLCGRALWLQNGQLKMDGYSRDVVSAYLTADTMGSVDWQAPAAVTSHEVHLKSVRLLSADDEPMGVHHFNQPFQVEISYVVTVPTRDVSVICRITDSHGHDVWTSWDTDTTEWGARVREAGIYRSVCKVPGALLRPGRYHVSVGSHAGNGKTFGYYENLMAFDVSEIGFPLNVNRVGIITPLLEWEVQRIDHFAQVECK
jgi:lipopolysaccharide transport system ATP-binding protein